MVVRLVFPEGGPPVPNGASEAVAGVRHHDAVLGALFRLRLG